MPRLALITPVDAERVEHLAATSASVAAAAAVLAEAGWELLWNVVVDGAAPFDETLATHDGFAPASLRRLHRRYGVSVARNVALVQNESEWVACVDGDDVVYPDGMLAWCAELAAADAAVGWVASSRIELDGRPSSSQMHERRVFAPGEVNATYAHPFAFHPNSVAYRRDVLLAAGGWPATPGGEDLALMLRVARDHPGIGIEAVSVGYRRWERQTVAEESFTTLRPDRAKMYELFGLAGPWEGRGVRRPS